MKGSWVLGLLSGLLLSGMALSLQAEEIQFELTTKEHKPLLAITLLTFSEEEIFKSLDEGLEVEIFFQIRLYEKVPSFFSFWGDRLIVEKKPQSIAYKNLFENLYIIKTGEQTATYPDKEDFLRAFMSIKNISFSENDLDRKKDYYIRARIHLNHVKLDPPLNLISLIYPVGTITPWRECTLAIK